jgi:hypothetical protein
MSSGRGNRSTGENPVRCHSLHLKSNVAWDRTRAFAVEATTNRLIITVTALLVRPDAKSSSESVNINFDIKIFVNSFHYQVITGVKKILKNSDDGIFHLGLMDFCTLSTV